MFLWLTPVGSSDDDSIGINMDHVRFLRQIPDGTELVFDDGLKFCVTDDSYEIAEALDDEDE
jgi:hypothetical protein